jgi:uncharacterized zinc-type alcohol dehydrogenase-like protein
VRGHSKGVQDVAMPTAALSVSQAGAPPVTTTIDRRDLNPDDVRIAISHAGICHSDIHQAREEWGPSIFPMVPGHEIAGTVAAVGPAVTSFAVGDRVGVGCMVESCRECEPCKAGLEQYCEKGMIPTYNGRYDDGTPTFGGYAQEIVVAEHFVVRIPDALDLATAAPLLCAGVTTYSPLRHWNAGPGKQVAIVGMGGLGHCAVQFAHALGAEVTVLSQTLSKEEDGRVLGADHYYATSDPETYGNLQNRFDLILNTVSANLPIDDYVRMLRLDGTLVHVGIPTEPDALRAGLLCGARRSVAGSGIGGMRETQEMLDFAAEHGIAARIELISADQVSEAWDRVVASDVRYRFVIDTSTIG